MCHRVLADLVLIAHLGFVVFAIFGALAVLRWRRIAWLHVPAVAWGAAVEFTGSQCPLTPLENWLRQTGGGAPYSGDFIAHYITPILYSTTLTRNDQLLYGVALLLINAALYGLVFYRRRAAALGASRQGGCR